MMIADKAARDPVWAAGDDGAEAPSPLERLVHSLWHQAVGRAQEVQAEAGSLTAKQVRAKLTLAPQRPVPPHVKNSTSSVFARLIICSPSVDRARQRGCAKSGRSRGTSIAAIRSNQTPPRWPNAMVPRRPSRLARPACGARNAGAGLSVGSSPITERWPGVKSAPTVGFQRVRRRRLCRQLFPAGSDRSL